MLRRQPLTPTLRSRGLAELAEIHSELGDLLPALACAQLALTLAVQTGTEAEQARLLFFVAETELRLGEHETGTRRFREVLKLYTKLGDTRRAAVTRLRLALAAIDQREYDQALDALRRLLTEFQDLSDRIHLGWTEFSLAKALYLTGNKRSAKLHAQKARDLGESLKLEELVFLSVFYLWRVAAGDGQAHAAHVYRERLQQLHERLQVRPPEAEEFVRLQNDERADA